MKCSKKDDLEHSFEFGKTQIENEVSDPIEFPSKIISVQESKVVVKQSYSNSTAASSGDNSSDCENVGAKKAEKFNSPKPTTTEAALLKKHTAYIKDEADVMPALETPEPLNEKTDFIKNFFQKMKLKNGTGANYNQKVQKLVTMLKKKKNNAYPSSDESSEIDEHEFGFQSASQLHS